MVLFAQAAKKPIRVGLLVWANTEQRGSLEMALMEGLRDQGYVEGKNLTMEHRYVIGDGALMDENARQLAALKLDVIVTTCSPSTLAAKKATNLTPIVIAAVADPVRQHLIASLPRPGENVTGLSSHAEEVLPNMLKLFASILPRPAPPVAVFVHSSNPIHPLMWKKVDLLAQQMKLKVVRTDIDKSSEIPGAFESAVASRAGALFVLPDDPLFFNHRVRIVELAVKNRLPAFYCASEFVEAGGLIRYGENLRGTYRNAAAYIDKIVKGEKPSTMPVAQPTRFELAVNRRTAKELGITFPSPILVLADQVVE